MDAIAAVKGTLRVAQISAASIIAKVVRDQGMEQLDKEFPQFGFAKHKGLSNQSAFWGDWTTRCNWANIAEVLAPLNAR